MALAPFMPAFTGTAGADPGPPRNAVGQVIGEVWGGGVPAPDDLFPVVWDAEAFVRRMWGVRKWRWESVTVFTDSDPEAGEAWIRTTLSGTLNSTAATEAELMEGFHAWEGTVTGTKESYAPFEDEDDIVEAPVESFVRVSPLVVLTDGAGGLSETLAKYDPATGLWMPRLEIYVSAPYSRSIPATNYDQAGTTSAWAGLFDGQSTALKVGVSLPATETVTEFEWSIAVPALSGAYWTYGDGIDPETARYHADTGAVLLPHFP